MKQLKLSLFTNNVMCNSHIPRQGLPRNDEHSVHGWSNQQHQSLVSCCLHWQQLSHIPNTQTDTDIHTHTHPFNGPLSGTTRVSRYQKGKNQSGFYWSKRQWVAVASAGPYAIVHPSNQTDNHASTPLLSFFTGRMPFLPPNQQCQSTEGTDRHWRYLAHPPCCCW